MIQAQTMPVTGPVSRDLATQPLHSLTRKAGEKVASAIQSASAKTGVDFSYLLQQAQVESSFNPSAKAKTSSASGLYQFIESTWLDMVNKYGDKYGLSDYADKISDSGKVATKADRSEILALRNDPEICSLMAGELAAENKSYLERCVGGDIGSTELYMAHFMGPGGAAKFLSALQANPESCAADAFPQAAAANKNVFFDKQGGKKTLEEVYAFFDKKFALSGNGTACVADQANNDPAANKAVSAPISIPTHETKTDENAVLALAAPVHARTHTRAALKHLSPSASLYDTSPATRQTGQHDQTGTATPLWLSAIGRTSVISPVDLLDLLKDHQAQG